MSHKAKIGLAVLVFLAGCQKPQGDVEGRITLDGDPLPHLATTLAPEPDVDADLPAIYLYSDETGAFSARSEPGKYRVMLHDPIIWVGKPPRISNSYHDVRTPLALSLEVGRQTFDIDLCRKTENERIAVEAKNNPRPR